MKAFITDLDRTIIHSKNPGFTCVETYGDREITFMTDKSITLLNELLHRKDIEFIPCTMRKYHQTIRVSFIGDYNPKYMICENGAQIFINGVLDSEWESYMRTVVSEKEVEEGIDKIKSLNLNTKDILNIDGFYIAISFYNEGDADIAFNQIKPLFKKPYNVIQVGRKMFVIHEKIDKTHAVEYLINTYKIDDVITSGDSDADKEFTKIGKSILPKHASFKHDSSVITNQSGIHATEEILEYVLEQFK